MTAISNDINCNFCNFNINIIDFEILGVFILNTYCSIEILMYHQRVAIRDIHVTKQD